MVRWLEIVIVIQNFSNNADTHSSTYYKRCCVTAIWFILLILPVTWSLFAFECYVGKEMKKSKLRFKQMFLPSISSVTDENNELWKTVRLTSFQKPKFQSVFNLLHVFPSVPSFVFAESFIPSFNVFSGYFYVSLNLMAVPTACHSLHFGKFRDTARLTSSVKPMWFLKFYISSFFKPKYKI